MKSPAALPLPRLTSAQVAAKYCSGTTGNWTAQEEADFFEELDSKHPASTFTRQSPSGSSTIPDALLRDFAVNSLKAKRCSNLYLEALRRVLWHLHMAELEGVEVRISTADGLGTARPVRTIIDQLNASGATYRRAAQTSSAHSQVMTFFRGAPLRPNGTATQLYEAAQRGQEAKGYHRWVADGCPVKLSAATEAVTLDGWNVPH